ncbi:MAG: glycosyltransferase family 4 protein [Actinomycetota bacterium]|nr:glycosyltransferase family 4 protein [Actinomycetota bacterium]
MSHLLVTNDFPPKIGGIQNYLWELWRRLPPDETFVLTTPHAGVSRFDAEQPFWIRRTLEPVLLPNPVLARRVDRLAADLDVDLVLLDPAVPLGIIGPWLERPYGVVLHGAEVTIPARMPGTASLLGRVLRGAELVVSAGRYAAAEAERLVGHELPTVIVEPGVDTDRFSPLGPAERAAVRDRFALSADGPVIFSLSRLVPRKGMDTLIRAAARLKRVHPDLEVVIASTGRDRWRLERIVTALDAPVRFLGRVDAEEIAGLYGAADVFAMLCRTRWGGLEQEGFGIVFLEAAAAGVPQVCGHSGGAAEAVEDGVTGLIVDPPTDVDAAVAALDRLLSDEALRARLAEAGRARAEASFSYDVLAKRLAEALP